MLHNRYLGELQQILSLWARCEQAGEEAILATVVKTQGSSYRMPGARMLVTRHGQRAGSVRGGCLEDDVLKKSWWLTEAGPAIRRYDTTPDGEIGNQFGLGCNGIIHILLERISAGKAPAIDLIRQAKSNRRATVLAHLIAPRELVGSRLTVDSAGHSVHNLQNPALAATLEEAAGAALANGCSSSWSDGAHEAFLETLNPPIRLLIFGAGDDAIALANLAKYFGWEVGVYDGRAHYARADRFPMADTLVTRLAGMIAELSFDSWTVAVTMNHSYTQDLQVLTELSRISFPIPYIGILGPRKRTEQLFHDSGLDENRLLRSLHSPMGLDIGADGPDQVALAVVSEIQAVMNGRAGGPLSQRRGSIHACDSDVQVAIPSGVCA